MEKPEQERMSACKAAAGQTEHALQRAVAFGAEVADDGSLEPRPSAFDWVEFGGVGRQANQAAPAPLALYEGASGQAAVRIDAVPDHDERAGLMLVKLLQEADDVLRANGARHRAEKEASSTPVRRVGQRSNRREMLPVAKPMSQDRGLTAQRLAALDRRPLGEPALVDEDDRGSLVSVSVKDRFLLKVIRNFAHDENGLEMVEWAIVGALILSIATTAIAGLAGAVAAKFNFINIIITSLP